MNFYKLNKINITLVFFCLLALSISFFVQFQIKLKPCMLCNLQRLVYLITGITAGVGYLTKYKSIALNALFVCFIAGAILSGYHMLVQYGVVKDFCIQHSLVTSDQFDNILSGFVPQKKSACSSKEWNVFGVPISVYNLVLFGNIMPTLIVWYLRKPRKTTNG